MISATQGTFGDVSCRIGFCTVKSSLFAGECSNETSTCRTWKEMISAAQGTFGDASCRIGLHGEFVEFFGRDYAESEIVLGLNAGH